MFERVLDPHQEPWLRDHCPTFTRPVLPLAMVAEDMAQAALRHAPGNVVQAIRELALRTWIVCDTPQVLRLSCRDDASRVDQRSVLVELEQQQSSGEFLVIGTACVVVAPEHAVASPCDVTRFVGPPTDDPYLTPTVFHGPAFHLVQTVWRKPKLVGCLIDSGAGTVPIGCLHPAAWDALFHGLPGSEEWRQWDPRIPADAIAYPVGIEQIEFFTPAPRMGLLVGELTLAEVSADGSTAVVEVRILQDDRLWLRGRICMRFLTGGPFARVSLREVRDFVVGRQHQSELLLSSFDGERTTLNEQDVQRLNWLPGTVETIFDVPDTSGASLEAIAVKEHAARQWKLHPALVEWDAVQRTAIDSVRSECRQPMVVNVEGGTISVRNA